MTDEKWRREMWQGAVPVMFDLAHNEITGMEAPSSQFMLLPRMSYLPLVTAAVRTHFLPFAPAREDEMWFECDGVPLKWHLPIGVLFDLLGGRDRAPLPLVVHFQGFPTKSLMRCKNQFVVRSHYFSSFKEACYLKFGTVKAVTVLPQADQLKLWDGVVQNKQDVCEAVHRKVMGSSSGSASGGSGGGAGAGSSEKKIETLPVRVVISGFGEEFGADFSTIQQPVRVETKDGKAHTLDSALRLVAPGLVFSATAVESAGSASGSGSGAASSSAGSAAAASSLPSASAASDRIADVEVVVQGTQPPMSTPLSWLVDNCAHPDGFLYVAVRKQRPLTDE